MIFVCVGCWYESDLDTMSSLYNGIIIAHNKGLILQSKVITLQYGNKPIIIQ
jgi:hypothetical protein